MSMPPAGGSGTSAMRENPIAASPAGDGQTPAVTIELTPATGLTPSMAAPVRAKDAGDTLANLLPNPTNRFAPLSSSLKLTLGGTPRSEFSDEVHVSAISSDGANGFRVTYVVDAEERTVHFRESDWESDFSGIYSRELAGEGYENARLWSQTDSFNGAEKDRGSTEFTYFDAIASSFYKGEEDADHLTYLTYGARTEAMPATGTATWLGRMRAKIWDRNWDRENPDTTDLYGDLNLTVDIEEGVLAGHIGRLRTWDSSQNTWLPLPDSTGFEIDNGEMVDGQFTADLTGVDTDPSAPLYRSMRGFEGDMLGEFYGPAAQEVGGVLNARRQVDGRVASGWFGGGGALWTNNPGAEDLLDHWDEPQVLRSAMGLSARSPSAIVERQNRLKTFLDGAGGSPDDTGVRFRNVRAEDVEIIDEKNGITYGQWKGGPAGTLNIEFDWRFAPDLDGTVRARMERAGKAWSWRFLDDFGMHTLNNGREIRFHDVLWAVLDEDVSTNGLRIFVVDKRSGGSSTGGARGPRKRTVDDYEPPFGGILLSNSAHDSTSTMVHEIGHVLGISSGVFPSKTRYTNTTDYTFEGPEAMQANGGAPVPFQWVNQDNRPVPPHTPGAEVDWGHLGVCTSIMAYCHDRTVYRPSELDFAFLADIGYEILDEETASEAETYGWGAWGTYSAWGVGASRTIEFDRLAISRDQLFAAADAFGIAPAISLADNSVLSGTATWSGSLLGADLGQPMLPPVFGDAQLEVDLTTLDGSARFNNLTVYVENERAPFRAPNISYAIEVAGNSFSDAHNRLSGGFYGPAHEEMAGVLDDRSPNVNLVAGFGGRR